jgi:hypothetical protein
LKRPTSSTTRKSWSSKRWHLSMWLRTSKFCSLPQETREISRP